MFGRLAGKGALVLPFANTEMMNLHRAEISACVAPRCPCPPNRERRGRRTASLRFAASVESTPTDQP